MNKKTTSEPTESIPEKPVKEESASTETAPKPEKEAPKGKRKTEAQGWLIC